MGSQEGIETLADVSLWRGIPEYIRSDNGPEFIAQQLRPCLAKVGTGTRCIEPGSPWEVAEVDRIGAALSGRFDVTAADAIRANKESDSCDQGQTHGHKGSVGTGRGKSLDGIQSKEPSRLEAPPDGR